MARGNSSFSRLVTTTLQNHGKEIFDAVSNNNSLFYMLNKRGNIKLVGGGRTFTHPVYHLQNSSFKSYAKLDTINTPIMDDITRAEYDIKCVAGSLVLSTMEEAMNAGSKEGLIKLAKEVKEGAIISMRKVMGEQVWKTGVLANDMDGLPSLIEDTPGTSTIGGIDSSDSANTWWKAQVGSTVTNFDSSHDGTYQLNRLLTAATFGNEGPTACFTTKANYSLYEQDLTGQIRYMKTELADSSFRHLAFATMPVLFDDNCPTNYFYMVDLNSIWLQLLSRGNFQTTPFQDSINQLSKIAKMYVFGNLTAGSLRTSGQLQITG